jgi:20S proteasome subunit alpha 1
MAEYNSRFITVFSTEGRIPQVEHAHKAVKLAEVTSIAAKGKNCIVVAVQKKVPDKLVDSRTVTHMFDVTPHIGACLVGVQHDVQYLLVRLRYFALTFLQKNDFEIPVSVLAQDLADLHQQGSMYQHIRPLAVSAILFGFEPSTGGFAVYRVETSGFSSGFRAVASGVKDVEAMSALEKKYREFETTKETAEFVLATLQSVIGVDFEPPDLEVAVVTRENPEYRILGVGEVDEILRAVAEKD